MYSLCTTIVTEQDKTEWKMGKQLGFSHNGRYTSIRSLFKLTHRHRSEIKHNICKLAIVFHKHNGIGGYWQCSCNLGYFL